MNVLVLNAGSSSLKFQVIATDLEKIARDEDQHLYHAAINHSGDVHSALEKALHQTPSGNPIAAVGHRIVHGGELFTESTIITDEVLQGIRDCVELAPLHNPANIEGIEAARKFFGIA